MGGPTAQDGLRALATGNLALALKWIGPSPEAIELLGDKLSARALAVEVDAPLAPGTGEPLSTWEEARDFAEEHGMPIAINR